MAGIRLKSISIEILKGLRGVTLNFHEGLTAIMGVNGAGKTTVLHALACAYKPRERSKCVQYRFQDFFIPNTDSLWQGSSFEIVYETKDNKNGKQEHRKQYRKVTDRWTPRFKDRPTRNVYYVGIESCLPDIESIKTRSRINYLKHLKKDEVSQNIIFLAGKILSKDYKSLLENEAKKRVFPGVELRCGLSYSSLSMGTGEQRILKILETVVYAENNSLILIDEIDLLLHVSAFNNLLNELKSLAKDKQLQIIFTTHSLEVQKHSRDIGIQYISPISGTKDEKGVPISRVHPSLNSDIIQDLTNERVCPATIYVEDSLSCTVVKRLLATHKMRNKTNVVSFGAASNAFTLAASSILENKNTDNILILLDGDVFRTEAEKMAQLERAITGTSEEAMKKREKALPLISQFNLKEGTNPEKFLYDLLLKHGDTGCDIFSEACKITNVKDNHEWIRKIASDLGEDVSKIVGEIVGVVENTDEWKEFVSPAEKWISERVGI